MNFSDHLNTIFDFARTAFSDMQLANFKASVNPYVKTQSRNGAGLFANSTFFANDSDTPTATATAGNDLFYGYLDFGFRINNVGTGTIDTLFLSAYTPDIDGTQIAVTLPFGSASQSAALPAVTSGFAYSYQSPRPILFQTIRFNATGTAFTGNADYAARFYGYRFASV